MQPLNLIWQIGLGQMGFKSIFRKDQIPVAIHGYNMNFSLWRNNRYRSKDYA